MCRVTDSKVMVAACAGTPDTWLLVQEDGASRSISDLQQVTLAPGVAQPVSFAFTPTEADGTSGKVIVVATPEQARGELPGGLTAGLAARMRACPRAPPIGANGTVR